MSDSGQSEPASAPAFEVQPQPAVARTKYRWRLAAAVVAGLAAAWAAFWWHRELPLRELPAIDLSQADPGVKTAIENARHVVQASPRSGAAWGELAQFLEAHSFHQEAVVCLTQAVRWDPQEFLWPYLRGDILSTRDPPAAARCFEDAALLRPKLALPRLRLGELYLEQRQLEQAAAEFEAAIRIDPASARAMYGLGAIAFHQGDFAQARRWVEQSFERDPEHRRTAALYLRVVNRLGDKEAIDRMQAVLDAMPAREVDWEDAFVEKVALKRRDPGGLAETVADLIDNGRLPEAVSTLEQLVASNPENPQWYSLLGMTQIRRRDLMQAAAVLDTGLARHPHSAELHFHRGVVYFSQEDLARAGDEFREATQLKPDFRDAWFNLGQTRIRQQDQPGAIAAFRGAIKVRPNDAQSFLNLGKLLLETGDVPAAREALEAATRIAPTNTDARQLLERLPTQPPATQR